MAVGRLGLEEMNSDAVVSRTRLLMGTVVNLTVSGVDQRAAEAAIEACFDRMSGLETVLSRFRLDSQLSQLNRSGIVAAAHPALVTLVEQSLAVSRLSGGAFDITVKPLLDLYQVRLGRLPGSAQIEEALRRVDYRQVALDGRTVRLLRPGMSVTLDGIAKGFIVDEGVDELKQHGFPNVLVEAGGDLMGLGQRASLTPWRIGLQAPRAGLGELMAAFAISNRAMATSGDYMQAFTPDFANHHIIDPRSGHSSPELASASVFAPTAALADALATAVMVMGKSGLALVEGLDGCAAYAVTKDLEVMQTGGVESR